jgi:hypothetical protein
MTKPFYKTKMFQKLNAEWANRLAKSGFRDIDPNDNESITPQKFRDPGRQTLVGTRGYSDLCQHVLKEHTFKTELHRRVFELHSEGKSRREIVLIVKREFGRKVSDRGVDKMIRSARDKFIFGKPQ